MLESTRHPRCHGHDTAFMSRFTDDAVETLAVLAECDAAVFSFGSFGWWAAWLAGGVRSDRTCGPCARAATRSEYFLIGSPTRNHQQSTAAQIR